MRIQITRIYDEISLSEEEETTKFETWATSSLRFYSQSTLRAVTSISIAIKFCYYRLVRSLVQFIFLNIFNRHCVQV